MNLTFGPRAPNSGARIQAHERGAQVIVVAGHLCLDVIPALASTAPLEPGGVVETGEVAFSTGGAVANVGLSLSRLGLEPVLVGRIGDDPFGAMLRSQLMASHTAVDHHAITTVQEESTSYSIVISPPDRDRTFLHHPGCNDTFTVKDLQVERWGEAQLLHFGYPPLMNGVYRDGGNSLAAAFALLRGQGVTVSLDMAMPDPAGASGRVDWLGFLETVLPQVDLYLPSWDETCFMLERAKPRAAPTPERLSCLAERLLDMGPAVVGLKLGDAGLYLRSGPTSRLSNAGRGATVPGWAGREVHSSNFRVGARGTTGAGDATIAGLLAAIAHHLPIEEAASMASAVGACSVEGVDAASGVLGWEETRARVAAGWPRVENRSVTSRASSEGSGAGLPSSDTRDRLAVHQSSGSLSSEGWTGHEATGVLLGPNDRGGSA